MHHREFAAAWDTCGTTSRLLTKLARDSDGQRRTTDMDPVGWQAILEKLRSRPLPLRSYKLDDGKAPSWGHLPSEFGHAYRCQ